MKYVFEGLLSVALLLQITVQVDVPKNNITAAFNTTVKDKDSSTKVQPTSSPTTAGTTSNSSSSGGGGDGGGGNNSSSSGGSTGGGGGSGSVNITTIAKPHKGGAGRGGFSAPLLLTCALVWKLWP